MESGRKSYRRQLDESRNQIIDYYLPRVRQNPPDAMLGQLLKPEPTEDDARLWLNVELHRVFPETDGLQGKMQLDVRYKVVTFETLDRADFLESLKKPFPERDWDKAYRVFRAASESG